MQRFDSVGVNFGDDRFGRAGGRHQAKPTEVLKTGKCLGRRGHVGQLFQTLQTGDRQPAQFALLHLADGSREIGRHKVDLPAQQIGERRAFAFVRHMHRINARYVHEVLARQMRLRAKARRAHGDGLGLGFG